MRVGLTLPYCEYGVEEKDPLFGPGCQISVFGWPGSGDATVLCNLLVNIDETGRRPSGPHHRESEPVGLLGTMIGILAQNHHTHCFGTRQPAPGKNLKPVN